MKHAAYTLLVTLYFIGSMVIAGWAFDQIHGLQRQIDLQNAVTGRLYDQLHEVKVRR